MSTDGHCISCVFWSEDDDLTEGTCVLRVNQRTERKWRTTSDFGCELWERVENTPASGLKCSHWPGQRRCEICGMEMDEK